MGENQSNGENATYRLSTAQRAVFWAVVVVVYVTTLAQNGNSIVGTPYRAAGAAFGVLLIAHFVSKPVKRKFGTPVPREE